MLKMVSEGYDVEVVQDIPSDFNCVICLKLMRNPVQFKCGHGMCCTCFKCLCKKTKQRAGILQCPQCREKIKENQVFPNTMMQRLILQLKVRCSNEEFGCMWIDCLDNLEDHLRNCNPTVNLSDSASGHHGLRRRSKSSSSQPSSPVIDPLLHSDLLLSINDQLSTLEKKLDSISKKKEDTPPEILNQKKENPSPPQERKQRARKQRSLQRKSESEDRKPDFWQKASRIHQDYYFLLSIPCVTILFLFAYFLFFSKNFNETNHANAISEKDSGYVAKEISQKVISPTSTIVYQDQTNYDHRAISHIDGIAGLVLIFIKMEFGRMKGLQLDIFKEIPSFEFNLKEKMFFLERKFSEYFDMSWKEMEEAVTEFDDQSAQLSIIENVTSLHTKFVTSANNLNTAVNHDLVQAEEQELQTCKQFCSKLKEKFENLLHRIRMFSEYDFSSNIYKEELFHIQRAFASLKANITKTSSELNADVYEKNVHDAFQTLRIKYQHLMNSYYANVTHALSFEVRFRAVMARIQNQDTLNNHFVWQIDTSKMASLPKDRAFMSDSFTSVSPHQATLLLYRDRQTKDSWKITFYHEEYLQLDVRILVLNQINESQLICIESLVGESRKKDSAKFKKFFTIPLTNTEMKKKGFIKDSIMYVRCTVS